MRSGKTAVLLAFSACIAGTAALAGPPPYLGWQGSPWARKWEVRRQHVGAESWQAMEVPKKWHPCTGSSTTPTGRTVTTCGMRLENPSALKYSYEIKEFSPDGTMVAVNICKPVNSCWVCEGNSRFTGDTEYYSMVTPHGCDPEVP